MPLNLHLVTGFFTSCFPKKNPPVSPAMAVHPAPIDRTPPARPFLDLPPEIRNYIYGYCTPVNGHARDYEGLFLSCKQVNAELEGEATKVTAKLLDRISKDLRYGARTRISVPIKFSDMTKVVVELPVSIFYWPRPTHPQFILLDYGTPHIEPSIALLLQLHLSELTITVYKDKPAPAQGYMVDLSPCGILTDISVLLHGGATTQQAAFSKEYIQTTLKQPKAVGTQTLIIGWIQDDFPDDINVRRSEHFRRCRVMRDFAEKDMVKSFTCDGKSCVRFELKTAGED